MSLALATWFTMVLLWVVSLIVRDDMAYCGLAIGKEFTQHDPPMVTDKIKALAELKAQAAKLEARVMVEREAELASLPEKYGYDSLKAFIKALKQAGGGKRKAKKGKVGRPRKRKRAKITPEVKAQVKAAVEAGKSGSAIAKVLGISVQSVQNVKKEFGLVKSRAAS